MWSLPWPARGREGVCHPARGGRLAIRCHPAPRRDAPLARLGKGDQALVTEGFAARHDAPYSRELAL